MFEHVSGAAPVKADARSQRKTKAPHGKLSAGVRFYDIVWKRVSRTFFDRGRLVRWERWRHRFDSKIARSGDAVPFINRMLRSLKDEYTWYRSAEDVAGDADLNEGEAFSGIGAIQTYSQEGLVIRSVFSGSPAEKAGLKPRDVVVSIDGIAVSTMTEAQAYKHLRGTDCSPCRLAFLRKGTMWEVTVYRRKMSAPSVHTDILPGNIGYIHLESFMQLTTVKQVRTALQTKLAACSALVLDLRGNGGGYIDQSLSCAALFIGYSTQLVSMTERFPGSDRFKVTVSYCGLKKDVVEPDVDVLTRVGISPSEQAQAAVEWSRVGTRCVVSPNRQMVVLVDADTGSAGELLTGALKDSGRAIVMGTRTFGKGIGQTTFALPGGSDIQVTTLHYRTPSGIWPGDAQRLRPRLKPDVVVRGGGRLLKTGMETDKQLQAACRYLRRKLR